ncbi:SANT/Myb domain [Dillenia turbinata]|uniref:SANT/Myb domain n=1 Tax=Dillenia turbinata TaxID=194707 RepID=A0AAN8UYU6_9MAGN
MVMESERKCSHCGNNGHNSRTCNGEAFKLFGVKIPVERCTEREDDWMKKSYSMGNYQSRTLDSHHSAHDSGLSDGPVHTRKRKAAHKRKKGISWTEEEHRLFLEGLEKLGKGDWKGISKKFVTTKTPTQVASHAQKYFLRRQVTSSPSSSLSYTIKKRRPSLFDMPYKESTQDQSPKGIVVPLPEMVPFAGMTSLGQGQQFAVFKAPQTQNYGNFANYALNINSPQFLTGTPRTYSPAKSYSLMNRQATEGGAAAANTSSISSSQDFLELRLGP